MSADLSHEMVDFALNLKFDDLGRKTVRETKRRWLDSFACALGAWNAEPCKIIRTLLPRLKKGEGAHMLGTDIATTPEWAAFGTSSLIRYMDFNDTYLSLEPAHPSDNIGAILAAADLADSSGQDAVLATVIAYEIQCRLCDAASIRARGWDHVTYGVFSTTLACGRLLGLTREQLLHAMGLAGVCGNALRLTRAGEISMWKGLAFANASRIGLLAVTMAKAGITGPAPIFSGDMGFCQQVSGPLHWTHPGSDKRGFLLNDTMIKCVSAEYHSHPAVESCVELYDQIKGERPQEILVETFKTGVEIIGHGAERWRPKSRETADHSLPFIVGVTLKNGELRPEYYDLPTREDAETLAWVDAVKVVEKPEYSALYPKAYPTNIIATMKDGRQFSKRVDLPLGHPERPASDDVLEMKFRDLAGAKFPEKHLDQVISMLHRLDHLTSVRRLIRKMELP
ncbi:MAG TPA: MmgE/PrpD family protein [Planctomycetota bacterium]|nr:MmgE/PrpD family protein [Planctomycetota bacterium]